MTDEKIEVVVVGRRCVYINDYRVVGGKPYFSENLPEHSFDATPKDIFAAFSDKQIEAELTRRKQTRAALGDTQ